MSEGKAKKPKKGLINMMVDAVTGRDDKEAAAAAAAEAEAKRKAETLEEETRRKIAEKRARDAEEQKVKETAAEKARLEAEAREKARLEAEVREKVRKEGEARDKVREFQERREAEMAAKKTEMEAKAAEEVAKLAYVVQPGDSLSKIAKEKLGNASRWPEIFELNKDKISDPNVIRVGQELRLPK